MLISILSVEVNNATSKAGKPYEQCVVAYRNMDDGKVASKTLMPFGFQKDTFVTLKGSKSGDVFTIDVQKNDAGYNDWIKAMKTTAPANSAAYAAKVPSASSANGSGRGFETPEERAKKQVYIIRQSSLSSAISALSVGQKVPPTVKDVIAYASDLEAYVLGLDNTEEVVKQDLSGFDSVEDPLPF